VAIGGRGIELFDQEGRAYIIVLVCGHSKRS
jgi:hypothetical protein